MSSIGEELNRLEGALFVGRESEIAVFKEWLAAPSSAPEILSVSGPGGVGKTTLLHAFARIAREQGIDVLAVDCQHLPATPEALLEALGGETLDHVLQRLNTARMLLIIDTFEELLGLSRYVQHNLLAQLDASVRVVIAGRYPLELAWGEAPSGGASCAHLPWAASPQRKSRLSPAPRYCRL